MARVEALMSGPHLSVSMDNQCGELAPTGTTITVGVADANGVAILSPRDDEQN